MKTDAIWKILNQCRGNEADDELAAAENALTAIEAENAAKDVRIEELEEALRAIADDEGDVCHRCEGNGAVYADGKAHYHSEGAPTVACPECCGSGYLPTDDPKEIASDALSSKPTGKVLVEVEKLQLIHRIVKMQESLLSYWHHRGDTTCEETITTAYGDVRVDSERLLRWLDAKIKEVGNA